MYRRSGNDEKVSGALNRIKSNRLKIARVIYIQIRNIRIDQPIKAGEESAD